MRPESCLLLPSRTKDSLTVPAGGLAQNLTFIVEARELDPQYDSAGSLRLPTGTKKQPHPDRWWGCHIGPVLSPSAERLVRRSLPRILDTWWRGPIDRLRANAWLSVMLADIVADYYQQHADDFEKQIPIGMPDAIRAACATALQNPRSVRRVADLAILAECSRQHLTRVFLAAGAESPSDWLRTSRLEMARSRIENGNGSLTTIAKDLGFADASNFSRNFSNHYGCPPRQWRLRHKRR